jgi:hypothetical protein
MMVKHRFDYYVKELSKEPASRRKFVAAVTVGIVGGYGLVPLVAQASDVDGERCYSYCKHGCCPKRAPKCCDKYRGCCPKKARYCAPDGCYR